MFILTETHQPSVIQFWNYVALIHNDDVIKRLLEASGVILPEVIPSKVGNRKLSLFGNAFRQ